MHYTPHVDFAFDSVEHIMREVRYGWLMRYIHSNMASMFFIVVYFHFARALLNRSFNYSRLTLWYSGLFSFILLMTIAFMGYVLPWGQMSFWGATVITNLFSAIPLVGPEITQWLWGDVSIANPTLNRFFSLHYLLPFVLVGFVCLHLIFLHDVGSSNPLHIYETHDYLPFAPYFQLKDFFAFSVFALVSIYFIFFDPNFLSHPDNYIPADCLVTPVHLVPEWYFLPFYAILRTIPNKLGGLVAMAFSIGVFFLLPLFCGNSTHHPLERYNFNIYIFFFIFILLIFLGSAPIDEPFLTISSWAVVGYFLTLFYELSFY
jgi:ubiquinol-cytochrome c reductase cytochrome b subunit